MKNQHVSGDEAREFIERLEEYQRTIGPYKSTRLFFEMLKKCETIPMTRMLVHKTSDPVLRAHAKKRFERLVLQVVFDACREETLKYLRDIAPRGGQAEHIAEARLARVVMSRTVGVAA